MSNLETKDLHAETRRARRAIFLIPTLFSAASAPPRLRVKNSSSEKSPRWTQGFNHDHVTDGLDLAVMLALEDTPVVLVHGPRQCGKTILAMKVGQTLGSSMTTQRLPALDWSDLPRPSRNL